MVWSMVWTMLYAIYDSNDTVTAVHIKSVGNQLILGHSTGQLMSAGPNTVSVPLAFAKEIYVCKLEIIFRSTGVSNKNV